jgi:hypothetical protein
MNWKLSSMTLAAFACAAITVAAQEPSSPAGQAGRTGASADEQTFVGCIAAADTAASPAAGSAKYVLKDAKKKESASASSAPGTSKPGAGSPAGTTGTTRTYQLDGPDATLSSEVGHQVEVVATMADSSAAPSTSPSASPSSASATPKLKVKTVKMIAAKCE